MVHNAPNTLDYLRNVDVHTIYIIISQVDILLATIPALNASSRTPSRITAPRDCAVGFHPNFTAALLEMQRAFVPYSTEPLGVTPSVSSFVRDTTFA